MSSLGLEEIVFEEIIQKYGVLKKFLNFEKKVSMIVPPVVFVVDFVYTTC